MGSRENEGCESSGNNGEEVREMKDVEVVEINREEVM